jgi:sugar lactone lactonase YvrE
MNDGCDPRGRFWAGTMAIRPPAPVGFVWLDRDGTVKRVGGVTISNGIDWSKDGAHVLRRHGLGAIDVFDYGRGRRSPTAAAGDRPEGRRLSRRPDRGCRDFLWLASGAAARSIAIRPRARSSAS